MKIDKSYLLGIYEIIRTGHWITDQVGQLLKPYDMTEPQYNVLKILKGRRGEPITVQEIQERMVQRTSNVTRIIDKLLDKAFVNRQECPTNRRKMDITITEQGLAKLDQLDQVVMNFHKPLAENMTGAEIEKLTELIIKLKANLK